QVIGAESFLKSAVNTAVRAQSARTSAHDLFPLAGIFPYLLSGKFVTKDVAVLITGILSLNEGRDLESVFHRDLIHEPRDLFIVARRSVGFPGAFFYNLVGVRG